MNQNTYLKGMLFEKKIISNTFSDFYTKQEVNAEDSCEQGAGNGESETWGIAVERCLWDALSLVLHTIDNPQTLILYVYLGTVFLVFRL